MQERKKTANFIVLGLVAVVAVVGLIAFQMTQKGQPTPATNAPAAAQGR